LCSHAAQRLSLFSLLFLLLLLLSSSLSFVSSLRSINPRITPHTHSPASFHPSVASPPTNRIFTLFLSNSFSGGWRDGWIYTLTRKRISVLYHLLLRIFIRVSLSPVLSIGISLISGRRDSQGNESPILSSVGCVAPPPPKPSFSQN
jgi:hypothetical protein